MILHIFSRKWPIPRKSRDSLKFKKSTVIIFISLSAPQEKIFEKEKFEKNENTNKKNS
jgi:hypothetical protein